MWPMSSSTKNAEQSELRPKGSFLPDCIGPSLEQTKKQKLEQVAVAVVGVDEEDKQHEEECWNYFVGWAKQEGAFSRSIEFGNTQLGRGAIATEQVLPNTTIASIPIKLAITVDRARDSPQGRILLLEVADKKDGVPSNYSFDRFLLCIYLISQKYDPEALFWHFTQALPTFNELPFNWSPEERNCLFKGTNMFGAVEKCLMNMKEQYNVWFPALSINHPDVFPAQVYTFDMFVWAESLIRSRGFPGRVANSPYKECVLPWLDLLNHQRATPIDWITTSDDGRISFKTGPTFTTVDHGCQVFNNYGAKSNEEFLHGYGFCMPDNPDDSVLLLIQLENLEPIRRAWISASNIEPMFYVSAHNLIPDDLMSVIRILACTDIELYLETEKSSAPAFISPENELAAFSRLRTMLGHKLDLCTRHQPQSPVLDRFDTAHVHAAQCYRTGQQRVLREALAHLKRKRLEAVSSRSDQFISSIPDKAINHDESSKAVSDSFITLLERAGGLSCLNFSRHGVFTSQPVAEGGVCLRVPMTGFLSLRSDMNGENEAICTSLLADSCMGNLVDWKNNSLLFWKESALDQMSETIVQRVAERREGLSEEQLLIAALVDAHTVEVEDDASRRYVVVALPRMPAVHVCASTVWEWRDDDLCLVSLQPGGLKEGARIVVPPARNATSEDLVEAHTYSFLENSQLPSFDMIALGTNPDSPLAVDECISTHPHSRTIFQCMDAEDITPVLEQHEQLLTQPIDCDDGLELHQIDVINRFRLSQLQVISNTKRIIRDLEH